MYIYKKKRGELGTIKKKNYNKKIKSRTEKQNCLGNNQSPTSGIKN